MLSSGPIASAPFAATEVVAVAVVVAVTSDAMTGEIGTFSVASNVRIDVTGVFATGYVGTALFLNVDCKWGEIDPAVSQLWVEITPPVCDNTPQLLLETGYPLLLESGYPLLLED
jgi:hypothetical protein